jgi:hypothetical protein
LLVEPQRTNLALYSEQFDNAYWITYGGNVITPNNTTAPNGTLTADKFSVSGVYNTSITFTANTDYSLSYYIKKDTATSFSIEYVDQSGPFTGGSISYNFATQAITITQSTNNSVSGVAENLSNNWIRLTIKFKTNVSQNYNYIANAFVGGSAWIWGCQLEAGSYPTSYIPTTSASVTRNADVISKTGISSLIGQTEGVIFIDAYRTQKSVNYQALIGLGNGTSSSEMMEFYYKSSNELTVGVYNSGQQFVNNTVIANGRHKIALAYKANDFALYIDGVLIASDTSGTVPTMNQLNIGEFSYTSGYAYADGINAVALWKTRLTNDQLEQLTGIGFNTYAEMANYYNYTLQ